MKKFSNYISEKLIINKNFAEDDRYVCSKPKGHGICLMIIVPIKNVSIGRIAILTAAYSLWGGAPQTRVQINDVFIPKNIKTDEGYYVKRFPDWAVLLLFEDDAQTFLKNLLKDPTQEIEKSDLPNIEKFLDVRLEWNLQVKKENKVFNKEEIQEMIDEIK